MKENLITVLFAALLIGLLQYGLICYVGKRADSIEQKLYQYNESIIKDNGALWEFVYQIGAHCDTYPEVLEKRDSVLNELGVLDLE